MEPIAPASVEERAAIREYCTSQVELAELATVLKKATELQLKVTAGNDDPVLFNSSDWAYF